MKTCSQVDGNDSGRSQSNGVRVVVFRRDRDSNSEVDVDTMLISVGTKGDYEKLRNLLAEFRCDGICYRTLKTSYFAALEFLNHGNSANPGPKKDQQPTCGILQRSNIRFRLSAP